jgi:hypothetical protein
MYHQILLVLVLGEQLCGGVTDFCAHRDDVERRVVDLAALDRPQEVGDAEERRLVLARVRESHPLFAA